MPRHFLKNHYNNFAGRNAMLREDALKRAAPPQARPDGYWVIPREVRAWGCQAVRSWAKVKLLSLFRLKRAM